MNIKIHEKTGRKDIFSRTNKSKTENRIDDPLFQNFLTKVKKNPYNKPMHKNKAKQGSSIQQDEISNLLERGVTEVIVKKDLEAMLRSGKKIKVYLGIDPTSTQIHLGNAIPLRKLRDFQNAGHQVIFLVGSFTALIGDTSDKKAMRQPLTQDQIEENFKTYKEQASKILDFSKCEIKYNGDWLGKLTFKEIIELANKFTVQQMIEREMYQMRLKENKPIGLHEFLYPLMQGYDSVAMDVDLEIGGNDQLFNMLAGRTLQKIMKNKEKHVLCTPLIEGTDGRKMSKSYGNTINIRPVSVRSC
jgi:tyrosyl-tRNA synthetase